MHHRLQTAPIRACGRPTIPDTAEVVMGIILAASGATTGMVPAAVMAVAVVMAAVGVEGEAEVDD